MQSKDTALDVYAVSIEGEHKVRPLIAAPYNQRDATLSPDGRLLAYVSDESGQNEVFVVSTVDESSRAQISTEGGKQPHWSKSGSELVFLAKDKVLSVKFTNGSVLNPTKPILLFEDKTDWTGFDVAADGRLIVARDAQDAKSGTQLNVVLNWVESLRK
jgi:serine/threonine-protein kinase